MDKNKIAIQRKELLTRCCNEFAEQYIAASYQDKEDSGMEDGLLNVYFEDMGMNSEDAIGQFYFSPIFSEEDEVQFFNAIIFLTEDIKEERAEKLEEAMSYVNFYLPVGSFSMDEKHEDLVYKLGVPLPIEMSDEALYDQVQLVMGNAMTFSDRFIDFLLGVNDGDREPSEIAQIVSGPSENE